jgi:hypothetical protein
MPNRRSFPQFLALLIAIGTGLTAPGCSEPARPVTVRLVPPVQTVTFGETIQFEAVVEGTSDTRLRWEVTEGGGQVDDSGLYTAPSTAGVFDVTATSMVDPSARGRAQVTVTRPPASVSLLPAQRRMQVGQGALFEAVISNGTGEELVDWRVEEGTAGGRIQTGSGRSASYFAPLPPGTYHVVATVQGQPQLTARATVTVVTQAPHPTLRGTVSYSGTKTGRVYILLVWGYGSGDTLTAQSGTSIDRPGSYTLTPIRGSNLPTYVVAFIDTQNQGRLNLATDPFVSVPLAVTGEDQVLDLTLVDPPASAPPSESFRSTFAVGLSDGLLITTEPARNPKLLGAEEADAYTFYWSQLPDPGPSNNLGSRTVAARHGLPEHSLLVAVQGLAPGRYYVSTTAHRGSTQGPASSSSEVVVGSAPGSGATLSGQISLETPAPSGHVYILASAPGVTTQVTRVAATTSPVSWSLPGLPEASYTVWALLDANGDGIIERSTPYANARTPVEVRGTGTVSAPTISFGPEPFRPSLSFIHQNTLLFPGGAQSGGVFYFFSFIPGATRPVAVRLQDGQGLPLPFDLPINAGAPFSSLFGQSPRSAFQFSWTVADLASALPSGSQISYEVRFDDGRSEVRSLQVPTVLPLATLTSPGPGALTTATPTFSWTLPPGLPASVTQRITVGDNSIFSFWRRELPLTQTEVVFNDDGKAGKALEPGEDYVWSVVLVDDKGNSHRMSGTFEVQ